jgi:di/tricarboxylate transporter
LNIPVEAPNAHAIAVMALTVFALFLFSRPRISLESSGLAVLTLLVVGFELVPYETATRSLGSADFLAGFGNPALITIVALLICAKALDVTGALHSSTRLLAGFWAKAPRGGLLITMVFAAVASMFMNNTPLVAMILPVLVAVCIRTQTAASSVLMPVGFATIIGGMATTIGTSTNLLVVELAADYGLPRFGMFDFALPVVIAGSVSILALWLIAPRVLPSRTPPMTDTSPRIFRAVLHVTAKSAAAGRTLADLRTMTHGRMQLERIERGEDLFIARLPTTVLRDGDRLYVRGQSWQLKEFETVLGAPLRQSDMPTTEAEKSWLEEKTQQRLAEIVITSASSLYGQTLKQSPLLEQFGLSPIAVHAPKTRGGDQPDEMRKLEDLKLRLGDVLLLQGDPAGINELKRSGQVLVLDGAVDLPHTSKALPATAIMIGVIAVAAVGILPIMVSALIGVVLCIATRCIRWSQLRAAVDANLVLMIVASLALGEALMGTGATLWLASLFVSVAGDLSPAMVIALLMLTAALLTEVVTNNAAAVLLTPIAFAIAEGLGLDARTLILAVMFGANMSYLTPLGYQTNVMVMNAGGYRFTDFVRLGLPLQIIMWAMLSWLLAAGIGIRS